MEDIKLVKKITDLKRVGIRTRGRPKSRWRDEVINGLKKLKLRNWRQLVRRWKAWNDLVQKTTTTWCCSVRKRRIVSPLWITWYIIYSHQLVFFTAPYLCVGTLFYLTTIADHFQSLRLAYETMTCNKQRVLTRDACLKAKGKHFQHLLQVWRSKILIRIAKHRPKIRVSASAALLVAWTAVKIMHIYMNVLCQRSAR